MKERIVVTGAAGTVGGALIRYLADRGYDAIGIDEAVYAPQIERFIGGVDLADATAVQAAVDTIDGTIAGLANVAGGFRWETVEEGSPDAWDRLYRTNVMTALVTSRAVLPRMSSGSAIVNIGAVATLKAAAGMGAYTASKSAVARFTEALAEEVKHRGIRVNAVLPSIIDTPANRETLGDADAAAWVNPSELAAVIAFLLSPEASGVTGACLPVTGRL